MSRVSMTVDPSLGVEAPALTQSRVRIRLRDGRALNESANGARGYPDRPASDDELAQKFLSCATRAIAAAPARQALTLLQGLERLDGVQTLTSLCRSSG